MKKIISFIVIASLVSILIPVQVFANSDMGDDSIYVDGVAFSVKVDSEMNTIVQTVGLKDESELILDKKGQGTVTLDETGEEYQISIKNLSEDQLDAVIEDEAGTETVLDDVDDIIVDEYETQAAVLAIPVVIGVGSLLTALVKATVVVIVAGVAVYSIPHVMDQIKRSPNYYYRAFRVNNAVFVDPRSITYSTAVSRIRSGMDVYTFHSANARNIVLATGLGVSKAEHHKRAWSVGVFFYHYHTASHGSAHSFFGVPVV